MLTRLGVFALLTINQELSLVLVATLAGFSALADFTGTNRWFLVIFHFGEEQVADVGVLIVGRSWATQGDVCRTHDQSR